MKEILNVEMKLDEYINPKFYFFSDNDNAICIELSPNNHDEIKKLTTCDETMLNTLEYFAETIGESLKAIKEDMTELYKEIKALKA